jgi:hypothetical protein
VVKRLAPIAAGLVLLVLLLLRRRRRSPRYPAKGGFGDAAWLPLAASSVSPGQRSAVGGTRRRAGRIRGVGLVSDLAAHRSDSGG